MNSCRNCQHAKHDGAFVIQLICSLDNQVVARLAKNATENRQYDEQAQLRAKTCDNYLKEEI